MAAIYFATVQSAAMPRSALCQVCKWALISPGSTMQSAASITCAPSGAGSCGAIAAMRSFSISTSPAGRSAIRRSMVTNAPPLIRIRPMCMPPAVPAGSVATAAGSDPNGTISMVPRRAAVGGCGRSAVDRLRSVRVLERTGQCAFRRRGQLRLTAAQQDRPAEDDDEHHHRQTDLQWSLQSARFLAEIIRSETVHAGPQDAARGVEQQEGKPRHAIGPGEQGGNRAEQRDEATEEHDLAAMTPKQILPDLDLALGQADVVTVAQQERIADLPPDPEPDDAADDRARRGSHDHQSNIEVVRRAGVDGREDQGGLARNRNADAFEADDRGDRPIAIDREQVRRRYGKEQTDLAILLDVRTAITQRSSRAVSGIRGQSSILASVPLDRNSEMRSRAALAPWLRC